MRESTVEKSLEGWEPVIDGDVTLASVIEHAFDYRGNVTLVMNDGREQKGYIANRNAEVADPFIELFDEQGEGPTRILYRDIRSIRFTGKDTAAGKSWDAWVKRRDAMRAKQHQKQDSH